MKKILVAFLAGAVLGVLYAPAKGTKTRKRLSGLGDEAKGKWNNVADGVAGKIENVQNSFNNLTDKAIEKVDGLQFNIDTPPLA